MKKSLLLIASLCVLAGSVRADNNAQRPPKRGQGPSIEPPVYVSKGEFASRKGGEISPEMRKNMAEMRQRRFAIMVLIHAYKLMPEAERASLKKELLRRIEADFQQAMTDQKSRIARAEADLARMKQELAAREANKNKLIEQEMERLLKFKPQKFRGGKRSRNGAEAQPRK